MTLIEYYKIIIQKYKLNEYTIKTKKGLSKPTLDPTYYQTYAHDYLIYEWMLDHKDDRWKKMIEFIVIPKGVNKKDCDVDFTSVNFEEFYTFLINIKNLEI